jgi:hypothetical protein
MKRAVVYGSALASFTVEEFGTDKIKAITEGDLEARMDGFKALMSFNH